MERIQQWLNEGCDYTQGIAIYAGLPKHNKNLLATFTRKNNTFNQEKLKYELQKLLTAPHPVVIATPNNPEPIVTTKNKVIAVVDETEKKTAVFFHQLPEELRPVLLEANQLHKENCLLKVTLNDLPANAEAKALEIQFKIHRNIEQNALCWSKIDFYLQHKVVPSEKATSSDYKNYTPAGLLRRQQLLFSSVSRLNTRLKQNHNLYKKAEKVSDKARLERLIAKQENNLLTQNEELLTITKLIDGR